MIGKRKDMKRNLVLVGLLLAVAGLTLGFAAFSNTLTIKSSATVTPDSSTFKVVFSSSADEFIEDELEPSPVTPDGVLEPGVITATNAIINNEGNPTITGINVTFTKPGYWVEYYPYAMNVGEYDAYLNEIKFNNVEGKDSKVVCTAKTDESGNPLATQSLVDEACKGIELELFYDGMSDFTNDTTTFNNTKIGKNEWFDMVLEVEYKEGSAVADGPFTVEFGDIELVWSTVDVNA